MKFVKLLKLFVIMALLLSSCASSGKSKDFSANAPMGLVTVISNYDINWAGEKTYESAGALTDFVRKALGFERDKATVRVSNAGLLVNEADSLLRRVIGEAGVFRLEDKDRLVNSVSYAWGGNGKKAKMTGMINAESYKPVTYRDRDFAAKLATETGIQSLLYITFTFNKEMISGFSKTGKCRAKVIMSAMLISPGGKILYRKEINTHSRDKIAVADGAYSEEELMDLFREAVGEACYRFVWDFTGVPKT
jgi:hypothetical protein